MGGFTGRLSRLCVSLLSIMTIMAGLRAHAQSDAGELVWLRPEPGADLVNIKNEIEAQGGSVLTLAPEGRLLVRFPGGVESAAVISGVSFAQTMELPQPIPQEVTSPRQGPMPASAVNAPATPPEAAEQTASVTEIEPNELSRARAALQGLASRPSSVDNSLSIYFPPVGNQGSQNSSVGWACGYYYNTYTQAMDANIDVSGGDLNRICSPAFVYNLTFDAPSYNHIYWGMQLLKNNGSCSWADMPYDENDTTNWPTEQIWLRALDNRTSNIIQIGTLFSSSYLQLNELEAIKQHLANGNLAVVQSYTYQDYATYPNSANVHNDVMTWDSGTQVGDQAFALVGYDDNKSWVNGGVTYQGAFLVVNSLGDQWGVYNSASTSKGFMWVSYNYFREGDHEFGAALYNIDRHAYRPRLYAAIGINAPSRQNIGFATVVGSPTVSRWSNYAILDGGGLTPLTDSQRIILDFTDGIPYLEQPTANLCIRTYNGASTNATITSAEIFRDIDGDGVFDSGVWSTDTPVTDAPGQYAWVTAHFPYCDGSPNHFHCAPLATQQAVSRPIPLKLTFHDATDATATAFTGTVSITGCVETTTTVGTGTSLFGDFTDTYWTKARSQTIYLKSELGGAQTWKTLMFDVCSTAMVPGSSNLMIRMKHTPLSSYSYPLTWESWDTGWTTVYEHPTNFSQRGWFALELDTPFTYNGTDNLMIDVSYSNVNTFGTVFVNGTSTPNIRTIHAYTSSGVTHPMFWSGTSNPTPQGDTYYPNVRLITTRNIAVNPTATGNFTAGVWNGSFSVSELVTDMFLKFSDGAGHSARSNYFSIVPPTGSLSVTIWPPAAADAGGRWRRSGTPTWLASGATESGLTTGTYTVDYLIAPGWTPPNPQQAFVDVLQTTALVALYQQMSLVWADFNYLGTELGIEAQPFGALTRAISAVASGGTIRLKASANSAAIRMTKPVRIESVGGTSTLGRD